MKHPSSQSLFQHWERRRGNEAAPDQAAFDLEACADVLGDCFAIDGATPASARLSFAGTRLCSLFGADLRGQLFPGHWSAEAEGHLANFFRYAVEEQVGTVAGLKAQNVAPGGALELTLLPLVPIAGLAPRLVGCLAPLSGGIRLADAEFDISSWRHLGPMSEPAARRPLPRAVRKIRLACGFLLYEGATAPHSRIQG